MPFFSSACSFSTFVYWKERAKSPRCRLPDNAHPKSGVCHNNRLESTGAGSLAGAVGIAAAVRKSRGYTHQEPQPFTHFFWRGAQGRTTALASGDERYVRLSTESLKRNCRCGGMKDGTPSCAVIARRHCVTQARMGWRDGRLCRGLAWVRG